MPRSLPLLILCLLAGCSTTPVDLVVGPEPLPQPYLEPGVKVFRGGQDEEAWQGRVDESGLAIDVGQGANATRHLFVPFDGAGNLRLEPTEKPAGYSDAFAFYALTWQGELGSYGFYVIVEESGSIDCWSPFTSLALPATTDPATVLLVSGDGELLSWDKGNFYAQARLEPGRQPGSGQQP